MLTLYVWAADTAGVFLDGNLLMPAAFTPGICSGEAIGCRPKDGGAISAALGEGQHTLSFELYQLGSAKDTNGNPFGLLFTGTAPASTETAAADAGAPEPGTWALLAGGLGWLMIRRRRNHIRS
jgi:hypothetical protein